MPEIHAHAARHRIGPVSRPVSPNKQAAKCTAGDPMGALGVLYGHALGIKQEATALYRQFAEHVADRGNHPVAELFRRLAELEIEHAQRLAQMTVGMTLPKFALGEYAWLYQSEPLPQAREFVFRTMTPRQAVEIAVRAEQRARGFFERVLAASRYAGVRELAIELRREADLHIAWLQDSLARMPMPFWPSEAYPASLITPHEL